MTETGCFSTAPKRWSVCAGFWGFKVCIALSVAGLVCGPLLMCALRGSCRCVNSAQKDVEAVFKDSRLAKCLY